MKISSIEIKNYRLLQDSILDLSHSETDYQRYDEVQRQKNRSNKTVLYRQNQKNGVMINGITIQVL